MTEQQPAGNSPLPLQHGPSANPLPSNWPAVPAARNRRRRWPWVVGIVAAFVLGVTVGSVGDKASSTSPEEAVAAVTTAPSSYVPVRPTTTPPPVVLPKPADFTIGINIIEKTCFGSAGCNITYRIDPKYNGTTRLPSKEITVVYEVRGGDGPQINRFTLTGGQASFPAEEHIQTKSSSSDLTAVVTQVI